MSKRNYCGGAAQIDSRLNATPNALVLPDASSPILFAYAHAPANKTTIARLGGTEVTSYSRIMNHESFR